jgi:hypothetical protein
MVGFHRKRLGGVGGFSGAALYAEFTGQVGSVGGGSARPGFGRVQRECGRNGAGLGCCSWQWSRARVPTC